MGQTQAGQGVLGLLEVLGPEGHVVDAERQLVQASHDGEGTNGAIPGLSVVRVEAAEFGHELVEADGRLFDHQAQAALRHQGPRAVGAAGGGGRDLPDLAAGSTDPHEDGCARSRVEAHADEQALGVQVTDHTRMDLALELHLAAQRPEAPAQDSAVGVPRHEGGIGGFGSGLEGRYFLGMVASIETRARSLLTPVPTGERDRIRAAATGRLAHRRWYDELACLHEVQVAAPERPRNATSPARVVAWNAERGRDVPALAALLREAAPQLVLLSEIDVGMARSGNRHTALDLAAALGFGCVYGVEFVELSLGGAKERAACAGQKNSHGLHGGAILSRSPLERPVVVRIEHDGAWLGPERDEPRVGGRIAVMGTWRLDGMPVTVASVHLESHSEPSARGAQIASLLDAIESYARDAPVLIGGDLNTFSMGLSELTGPDALKQALAEDPGRLGSPVRHEPLFEIARSRGYTWDRANELGTPTHRVAEPTPSHRTALKLDWFLVRGLSCSAPAVLSATAPDGRALSDHEPIAVTCEL